MMSGGAAVSSLNAHSMPLRQRHRFRLAVSLDPPGRQCRALTPKRVGPVSRGWRTAQTIHTGDPLRPWTCRRRTRGYVGSSMDDAHWEVLLRDGDALASVIVPPVAPLTVEQVAGIAQAELEDYEVVTVTFHPARQQVR